MVFAQISMLHMEYINFIVKFQESGLSVWDSGRRNFQVGNVGQRRIQHQGNIMLIMIRLFYVLSDPYLSYKYSSLNFSLNSVVVVEVIFPMECKSEWRDMHVLIAPPNPRFDGTVTIFMHSKNSFFNWKLSQTQQDFTQAKNICLLRLLRLGNVFDASWK